MIGDKIVLHEYSKSKEDCAIRIIDGTLSKIEGIAQKT